jgi:hypothetical protein
MPSRYNRAGAGGILKELELNGKFELLTEEKQAMLELKMEIEKEKAKKQQAKEFAKKLKDEGMGRCIFIIPSSFIKCPILLLWFRSWFNCLNFHLI